MKKLDAIIKFFKEAFLPQKIDVKAFKEEYKNLYTYLSYSVVSLDKPKDNGKLIEETVKEQTEFIAEELDTAIKEICKKKEIPYKKEYVHGGLTDKEIKKIEKKVVKAVEKKKHVQPKPEKIEQDFYKAKNYEADFVAKLQHDCVLKNLDLNVFPEIMKIAEYTKGELTEVTKREIFDYIRQFSPVKKGNLYDSTYFYMERSAYTGGGVFQDIENEFKKEDVNAFYGMIAYYVDHFYDMYAEVQKEEKIKAEKDRVKEADKERRRTEKETVGTLFEKLKQDTLEGEKTPVTENIRNKEAIKEPQKDVIIRRK